MYILYLPPEDKISFFQQKLTVKKNDIPILIHQRMKTDFPLAPMGILAPGSVHAWPSARRHINTSGREEERRRNNAINMGHYILSTRPKGSAGTSLRPILNFFFAGQMGLFKKSLFKEETPRC